MPKTRDLDLAYPQLGRSLGRENIATLPTPAQNGKIKIASGFRDIAIKRDDLTGRPYGGNKIRKLEYALWPAHARHRRCIATFGAVGSNHALATALYSRMLGYDCLCFLVHQPATPAVRDTLLLHLSIGSQLIRYGGGRQKRIATLRRYLKGREAWIIPAGGSSWLGTVGFVNAGLEVASQIARGEIDRPERVYVATGTMGTSVGIAIGLALAGIDSLVEAIRVSATPIANERLMSRLLAKTVSMMRRLDPTVPAETVKQVRIRLRHEFFAGGYAQVDEATRNAINVAESDLGLVLEGTYTGKAMAALLHDLHQRPGLRSLFWNTYNSAPLSPPATMPDIGALPDEFRRYLD